MSNFDQNFWIWELDINLELPYSTCACMGENYSTIRREDKVNARTNTWMDEKESHKAILIM